MVSFSILSHESFLTRCEEMKKHFWRTPVTRFPEDAKTYAEEIKSLRDADESILSSDLIAAKQECLAAYEELERRYNALQ